MLKKIILSIIVSIAFLCNGYSQENKNGNELIFNSQIGFGTLEIENFSKLNVSSIEAFLGIEVLKFKKNKSLITGIEYLNLSGNLNSVEINSYLENKYLNIPIIFRIKKDNDSNISFFGDVGVYGSYLLNSKFEDIKNSISDTENGIGLNFGLQASIGANIKFDDTFKFNIGIKSKSDILNNSKNSLPEYKLTNMYSVVLGFNYKIK